MKISFELQRFVRITNDEWGVTVNGTNDEDIITNSGDIVTIFAGASSDTVSNSGVGVVIQGDADNDSIVSTGDSVTIDGGAGNDYISLYYKNENTESKGNVIQYSSGDGSDTIVGFSDDDTLQIASDIRSTQKIANNFYFIFSDGGKITLKDTKGYVQSANFVTVKGGNTDDDGTDTDDDSDDSETNTWKVSGTTATYGTSSKTLIKITGVKSGTSTNNFKLSGKTVTLKAAALNKSKVTITDNYKLALAGDVTKSKSTNKKWSVFGSTATYKSGGTTAGYKLASDSKSISYTSGSGGSTLATITGIKSKSGISVNNQIITVKSKSIADGKTVSVTGASYKFKLNGTSGRNTLQGGANNDTLTGGGGADLFIHTGGNDIITDYTEQDKIKISANYTGEISGDDIILTTSKGTLIIKNSADKSITINGVTKKYSSGSSQTLTLTNASDSEIELSESYTNADASKRTQSIAIFGNSKNNSIIGGSAADTLFGGEGNDTLTGGAGSDIFAHSAGNDVIVDYTVGKDMIYLDSTAITGFSLRIKDVILSTDNGSINIKGGKDKKITVVDSSGITTTKTYGALSNGLKYDNNNTILKASKSFTGDTIDLADYITTVRTVDASAVRDNLEIVGNRLNNSLVGGSGSDTIAGGAGNDTLTGNGGRDIFVYSAGDDIITDYTAGKDKVKLSGTTLKDVSVGNNNIVFTTSTGTLTIKNGAGKSVTIIDKDGKEITQRYSANIAEILADNSIGEFENYSEKLTQENLITFTE